VDATRISKDFNIAFLHLDVCRHRGLVPNRGPDLRSGKSGGAQPGNALQGSALGECELTDIGHTKVQPDSFYFTRFSFRRRRATAYLSIASFCAC